MERLPGRPFARPLLDFARRCRPSSARSLVACHVPRWRRNAAIRLPLSEGWLSRSGRSAAGLQRVSAVWPSTAAERWESAPGETLHVRKRVGSAARVWWLPVLRHRPDLQSRQLEHQQSHQLELQQSRQLELQQSHQLELQQSRQPPTLPVHRRPNHRRQRPNQSSRIHAPKAEIQSRSLAKSVQRCDVPLPMGRLVIRCTPKCNVPNGPSVSDSDSRVASVGRATTIRTETSSV